MSGMVGSVGRATASWLPGALPKPVAGAIPVNDVIFDNGQMAVTTLQVAG
jgi:hypothetical protein